MANFDQLKQSVAALIRTNGAEEITGQIMQDVLLTIINSISGGYMFGGVAQHNGNVGNPDYNVFYLAGSGAYTGYGGAITIEAGCYGVFRYNGTWTQEVVDIGVRLSGSIAPGETRGVTGDVINTALQQLFNNVMNILDTLTFTYNTPSAQQATKAMLDVKVTPTGGASHVLTTLTLASATVAAAGLMSAEDKQKVDRMLTDFRSLSLTDTTAAADQATKIVQTLSATLGENPEAITTMTFLAATASKAGLLSAADKAKLDALWSSGYQFAGIATPSTTPISTTSKIFYIATEAGTYFNAVTVTQGINILSWDGSAWSVAQVVGIDNEPTAGSDRLVKSGGVFGELALGAVYDVSAKNPTAGPNSNGKWESLSALLSDANLNTLIPTSVRKGGMSIKYVQSSDNKYVQWRLMLSTFTAAQFTNTVNWQGVDDVPTAGSDNLVKSGGVYSILNPAYINYSYVPNVVKAVKELYLDNHADGLYINSIVWTGTKLTLTIKDSSDNVVAYINNKDAFVGEVLAFKSVSGASIELKGYIVLSDTTVSISNIHANIEAAAYDLKYSTNILEYLTKPDDTPIEGSYKPVGSGGMYDIIAEINNTLNEKADYEDVGFEDWEDVSSVGEPLSSKYINYNGDLVDPSINSFKVYSFSVTPGDTVKIHCALSAGSSYAYAFYNSNSYSSSTAVGVGPAVTSFVDPMTVIVPNNAAYILIQQFNGSGYGLQKRGIALIKDMIPEMVSDINNLKENAVDFPLNVSRFDVGGTLPAGHRASWITINRRMDEEFDSVLNFCNKTYPNLTNKWFDFYAVGKHARGIDGVSKCDNYIDWITINGLSTSDALMMAVIVGAVNNIDGDNTTVKRHTGGAHAYGNSATGATPTMRELSNIVRVDGKSIAIGEKNIKGNKCTIDVINNVQGYNTCKEDGTGREIVQQRYHVEVTNEYCEVVTELVALEEVIVYGSNVVTGIGMSNMQYRFIGSDSKRGLYTYNGSGNVPSNGDSKIDTLRVEKDGYIFDVEYDLDYGLGNKLMPETYNLFVTNAAKAYFANIPSGSDIHLNEGDSINWRVRLNIRKA